MLVFAHLLSPLFDYTAQLITPFFFKDLNNFVLLYHRLDLVYIFLSSLAALPWHRRIARLSH